MNAPIDLVGNPERWIYMQTTTPSVAAGASKETTPSRAAVVDVLHRRRRCAYLVSPTPPLCNGIRIKQSRTTPRCYYAMAGRVDSRILNIIYYDPKLISYGGTIVCVVLPTPPWGRRRMR